MIMIVIVIVCPQLTKARRTTAVAMTLSVSEGHSPIAASARFLVYFAPVDNISTDKARRAVLLQ